MSRRKKADDLQFSDHERMNMFVNRAQDLVKEPIWNAGGLSITTIIEPPAIVREPDASHFKSYLVTFRPFVLENDAINFHSIRGIAHRLLRNGLIKEDAHLHRYKQMWNEAMNKGRITVIADGITLSPEAVLDAHLYGYFFHYTQPHVAALKQFEAMPVRIDKIRLYDTLADLTEVIFQLANFIAFGMKHNYFNMPET